ncbi:RIO1-domain-containing protein [Moesziomyces antarcticus]|uniref:Related to RIO2 protein n=2 Tax=Pseudozyma antarctica TaxID=84753 RepID=A0A5C3FVA6_PSEA2|nr:RIO1-domain-containing protein [Moesziomyces antarcticus]GAK66635.1 RIO1-domain-containing protein [Moesziomyces antarcticus]SPO47685.1 related to RIO2 protein [Moesziomyces antarcticus]
MRLDATDLRYISSQEFRVLTAIEMGSKNHEVVPSSLAAQICGLHHSGINKLLGSLAKRNLIARVQNTKYDGYRLTYGGYDYLALRAFSKRDSIAAVGRRIGVGKESDIMIVSSPEQEQRVLKIHRLGRISFRAIKEKRDYMGKRKSASWMYMSRLAAAKEYAFMKILHEHGFPVPQPIDQARHCIVMSYIDAFPLRQIAVLPPDQIPLLYSALMKLIVRLARAGLIHGDFNEFNLLIREVSTASDEEYDSDSAGAPPARDPQPSSSSRRDPTDSAQQDTLEAELAEGHQIERGNGFERVVAPAQSQLPDVDDVDDVSDEVDQEDEEEDDDDEAASETSERQIHLGDDVTVEPILIDFPQMVSINHENAEYYFDRDVECVRRFFRKRFRYHSDEFPRFQDVVPEFVRKQTKLPKSAPQPQDVDQDAVNNVQTGDVRLDLLAKASGFGGSKQDRELEQYMSSLRLSTTQGMIEVADSSPESGDEVDSDEQDEEEDSDQEDGEDEDESSEDDEEDDEQGSDAEVSRKARKAAQASANGVKPSRGAARKALLDGDDSKIAQLVASDRAKATRRAEKHHGKKAHAGKGGRAHAGGKAKTGKARMISDSMDF